MKKRRMVKLEWKNIDTKFAQKKVPKATITGNY